MATTNMTTFNISCVVENMDKQTGQFFATSNTHTLAVTRMLSQECAAYHVRVVAQRNRFIVLVQGFNT